MICGAPNSLSCLELIRIAKKTIYLRIEERNVGVGVYIDIVSISRCRVNRTIYEYERFRCTISTMLYTINCYLVCRHGFGQLDQHLVVLLLQQFPHQRIRPQPDLFVRHADH